MAGGRDAVAAVTLRSGIFQEWDVWACGCGWVEREGGCIALSTIDESTICM
jgi:hypothetical protein